MGYESSNYRIKILGQLTYENIINSLRTLGFKFDGEYENGIYFKKSYESGIIELEIMRNNLNHNVRIAKPNHENIIGDFMKDMLEIAKKTPIMIYDLQLKKEIDFSNYCEMCEQFHKARMDFLKFFPNNSYPICCKDVSMKN